MRDGYRPKGETPSGNPKRPGGSAAIPPLEDLAEQLRYSRDFWWRLYREAERDRDDLRAQVERQSRILAQPCHACTACTACGAADLPSAAPPVTPAWTMQGCPECRGTDKEGTGTPSGEGGEDFRECFRCQGSGFVPFPAPSPTNRMCQEIENGGPEDCRQMCPSERDLWCPSCRRLPRTLAPEEDER